MPHTNRESWLSAAVGEMRGYFKQVANAAVPPVLVSVGWGFSTPLKRRGECWPAEAGGGIAHIFISPQLDGTAALATLAHELCHAVDNCRSRHSGPFIVLAQRIGLEPCPKWTATGPGPEMIELIEQLCVELGPYPHQILAPQAKTKKQATRMRKVACACGYTVRTTNQWLDLYGPPYCPNPEHGHQQMEAQ